MQTRFDSQYICSQQNLCFRWLEIAGLGSVRSEDAEDLKGLWKKQLSFSQTKVAFRK